MDELKLQNTNNTIVCPFCDAQIDPKAYFCPNCGKKVREQPISTGIGRQLYIYLVSALAPPFGLFWVSRYWKQPSNGKQIAIAIIVITVISLVLMTWATVGFINQVNVQLSKQLNAANSPYGY